jgi:hypothetical protein
MYPATGVNSKRLWGLLRVERVLRYWALAAETTPQASTAATNKMDFLIMHRELNGDEFGRDSKGRSITDIRSVT